MKRIEIIKKHINKNRRRIERKRRDVCQIEWKIETNREHSLDLKLSDCTWKKSGFCFDWKTWLNFGENLEFSTIMHIGIHYSLCFCFFFYILTALSFCLLLVTSAMLIFFKMYAYVQSRCTSFYWGRGRSFENLSFEFLFKTG